MVVRLSVMAGDNSSLLNKSWPIALSCEDFYTKRVHYLERFRAQHESSSTSSSYRLSKSANSINEYQPSSNSSIDISESNSNFGKLGNDIIYLLEKDVQLTRQLLDLNNAIEQLKLCYTSTSRKLPKVLSNSSLSSLNSLNNECESKVENFHKEVNHIEVNKDDPDTDPPRQYFQRQYSALRIPIMRSKKRSRFPTEDFTSGSRHRTAAKVQTQAGQRKSFPFYEQQSRDTLHSPNSDSGLSAESQQSGHVITVGSSTVLICHGSQSSFDSGVHSASPEEREEIFV